MTPKGKRVKKTVIAGLQFGVVAFVFYFIVSSLSAHLAWDPWPAAPKPKPVSEAPVKKAVPPQGIIPKAPAAPQPVSKPAVRPRETVQPPLQPGRMLDPSKPKIILILDDMGHTRQYTELLEALGRDVTYAILPLLAHSGYFGRLSRQTGAEVILHLPLEASDGTIPGPGLITARMTDEHVREMLARNLDSVPYHRGVNNHMGSAGTADPHLMRLILEDLQKRGLFFLDSYTTSNSVSTPVAREIGLPLLKRDVFLDNVDSPEAIQAQLEKLTQRARKKGYAIGIGHYRYNTLKVLNEEIPLMKRAGFELVALSELLEFLRNRRSA